MKDGKRLTLLACVGLLSVLGMVAQRAEYLDFLYRYMSLPDRADYSRAFYEQNVAASLRARNEMPWGATVPEREFRHFVLPVRVNNEHLDNSREVFYQALKPRVEGMSMSEAVLEVNHWCHEHVTYRPTDARTSSPLCTIRTAYGRCGEESTLLVAALRAVGIPARQVYTPRWAHTDDNHAWVEAWADGQWHFLGACEPEPVLDLGWFNESASRAMLMHTKVFGHYDGPEEVVSETSCYTEINVTSHYAPTSRLNVTVLDEQGKPAQGALVEFKLYNYAEFYTVASKTTDSQGRAWLTAGRGDLLVWASKNGKTAILQVTVGRNADITMQLSAALPEALAFDLTPPAANGTLPAVTDAQRAENNRRLAAEDSIRHAYESRMPVEAWRGNHGTIREFLNTAPNKAMALKLLDVISAKDLRDIEIDVLRDNQVVKTDTSALFLHYVLNPRVEHEWLTPYKAPLRQLMSGIKSPAMLAKWCSENIVIDNDSNPQQLRMTPMSVYREGKTDELGRSIFFVAAARSLGWPARINEVDGRVQYHQRGKWHDVDFGAKHPTTAAATKKVELQYNLKVHYIDDPKYYTHFTLSRVVDGRAQLLTFPEDATWMNNFSKGVPLERGTYLLTSGTRMANGKVLAYMQRFTIDQYDKLVFITLRENDEDVQVIGNLNAENTYYDLSSSTDKSLLSTTGRGYYVLGIVSPNHEPTNHALRDIAACRSELETWGLKMILLLESKDDTKRFNYNEFDQLPSTKCWGVDNDGIIMKEIKKEMKLESTALPLFLICDSFNRVVYIQQGYTINMGEQLLKIIKKL